MLQSLRKDQDRSRVLQHYQDDPLRFEVLNLSMRLKLHNQFLQNVVSMISAAGMNSAAREKDKRNLRWRTHGESLCESCSSGDDQLSPATLSQSRVSPAEATGTSLTLTLTL